jgi:ribosomal protein S18 acetylase RimI-like enzyme
MATRSGHEVCDIDRLVVDPAWFRRGLARSLVTTLADRGSVTVSTGTANFPGVDLYESMGFLQESTEVIAPGVTITHLRRTR